ncbi:CgeB family protein [Bordetella hinzii]|uniref:CgeB family protein n=1 Tax=Bordetella hinzii TaxID=103855 RepID=UPI001153A2E7|nr:glycosyltransferase [Bordetella hinzii]QDJ32899.1 spore coat protein [Bordetella hinzii]
MLGPLIRKLGAVVYDHPEVAEDVRRNSAFGNLKIALVADSFTSDCLAVECRVRALTPGNFTQVIAEWKPDLVFVESAFHGAGGSWRYELAKQPRWLRLGAPTAIFRLVEFARGRGIPTVFWNKDDGAYFDAFIHVAQAFDYVFTTDHACVPAYRKLLPAHVPVNVLSMPYQPAFHHFTGFHFVRHEACFTGSYYRRILNERRRFLDMVFDACEQAELRLNVYDRNHDRLSRYFEFRFPKRPQLNMHGKVRHSETAAVYKSHVASLNVNSVTDSDTMCSRRLLEILACGGIAVTNPSRAVDRHFREFCHVVSTPEETRELFARLRHGPTADDKARAEAGAIYVRQHHTWAQRLEEVCAAVKR